MIQKEKRPLNTVTGRLNSAFDSLPTDGLPPEEIVPVPQPKAARHGRVVLRREKAHRGGKTVVVIDDFATHIPLALIETLAGKLKKSCGCGGTVKDRTIEIQGDQPGRIRELLEGEGFQVAGVK